MAMHKMDRGSRGLPANLHLRLRWELKGLRKLSGDLAGTTPREGWRWVASCWASFFFPAVLVWYFQGERG